MSVIIISEENTQKQKAMPFAFVYFPSATLNKGS
jgi:hypothetical protein